MNAEWVLYKNHFSPEYCKTVLDIVLEQEPIDAKVGLSEENDNNVRRSKLRFIGPDHSKLYYVFDHLWRLTNFCNDQNYGFNITRLTGLQTAEYSEKDQGEYKKHHDVFWYGNGDEKYHRKLSCIIQLTDPSEYEGGDFEFYDLFGGYPNKEDLRSQGSVLFFPSFYYHAALPVTKGTRYSMAAWFEGPKWR